MFEDTMEELTPDKTYRKLMLGLIAFLSFFFIFMGGYIEWVLGLIVLALMCLLIVSEISDRSRDMSFWKRDNELDIELNMNLKEISKVADRAYNGKKVSKAKLEEHIIKEFLEKIKIERSLSNDEIENLLDDPDKMKKIVDDEKITSFILGSKSYTDIVHEKSIHERPDTRWSRIIKKFKNNKEERNEDYKERINEVLERMEEWN